MTVIGSNAIWLDGNSARAAGQPVAANPCPAGSQGSAEWLEGYTAAGAEAEQEAGRAEAPKA